MHHSVSVVRLVCSPDSVDYRSLFTELVAWVVVPVDVVWYSTNKHPKLGTPLRTTRQLVATQCSTRNYVVADVVVRYHT